MKTLVAVPFLVALATPALAAPSQTFTGKLLVEARLCPVGVPCPEGISLQVGKLTYPILTDKYFTSGELTAFRNATVKITGHFADQGPTCAPGQACPEFVREVIEPDSATISVRGKLGELYFDPLPPGQIPTFPVRVTTMELSWANGGKIGVNTDDQNFLAYNNKTVWVQGTIVKGGGDLATYFKAETVNGKHGAVQNWASSGSNTGRGTSTLPTTVTEAGSGNGGGGTTR